MTPAKINAEVAKLCPSVKWADYKPIDSLDACAEFEAGLSEEESRFYRVTLGRVILGTDDGDLELSPAQARQWFFATPAQRCEAFLRIKGKWRD